VEPDSPRGAGPTSIWHTGCSLRDDADIAGTRVVSLEPWQGRVSRQVLAGAWLRRDAALRWGWDDPGGGHGGRPWDRRQPRVRLLQRPSAGRAVVCPRFQSGPPSSGPRIAHDAGSQQPVWDGVGIGTGVARAAGGRHALGGDQWRLLRKQSRLFRSPPRSAGPTGRAGDQPDRSPMFLDRSEGRRPYDQSPVSPAGGLARRNRRPHRAERAARIRRPRLTHGAAKSWCWAPAPTRSGCRSGPV